MNNLSNEQLNLLSNEALQELLNVLAIASIDLSRLSADQRNQLHSLENRVNQIVNNRVWESARN